MHSRNPAARGEVEAVMTQQSLSLPSLLSPPVVLPPLLVGGAASGSPSVSSGRTGGLLVLGLWIHPSGGGSCRGSGWRVLALCKCVGAASSFMN